MNKTEISGKQKKHDVTKTSFASPTCISNLFLLPELLHLALR